MNQAPNFAVIEKAVRRDGCPERVPFYEHFVDDQIIEAIMGYDFATVDAAGLAGQLRLYQMKIEFYRQLGYDYFPFEIKPNFATVQALDLADTAVYSKGMREWTNEHSGPLQTRDDVENDANWPEPDRLFNYELFNRICELLPENMKIIGGASGGPFEHASFLMGTEVLFINIYEDEELVARLFDRIGAALTAIAARLARHPRLGIYRFGDDLGYKNATMLSPQLLRKYVFPWQKSVVEVAHRAGKPFILHSCGQLEAVMDDLIDTVGIDAKHSFEDVILPVTEAKKRWGDRLALLGGVDVDFLCRSTPRQIKEHTREIMAACSPNGGYAIGSGNTIANYIPVPNYLAMLGAAREFNAG